MEPQNEDVERELRLIAAIFQMDPRNKATLTGAAAEIARLRAENERLRAAADHLSRDGWIPIEQMIETASFIHAPQLLCAHREHKWIRMGRFYPELGRWYYSATNERSQYAQVEGDAPTHFQYLRFPK